MFQNLSLIHIDLPVGPAIWYKWKSIVKNYPPICFKIMLSYWKRENVANINFCDFNKLNDWSSQWKKSNMTRLTRWKVMASKSEKEIAADITMWLTRPSHLNVNIKRIVAQC